MLFYAFGLSNIGTILLFLIIICFLIAWHELGHLLTAKACNVYCYEYAIGFGPVIYRNKKKETHFTIRAIPLGGFVKMAGEEGVGDDEVLTDNNGQVIPDNRILANRPLHQKALVLAAGGIMNMIMAYICFYFYLAFSGGFAIPSSSNDVFVVTNNETPSMLQEKGMETNDIITVIEVKTGEEVEYVTYEIEDYDDIIKALDDKKPTEAGDVQDIKITFKDVSENNALKTIDVSRNAYKESGTDELLVSQIGLAQNRTVYEYNALTSIYGTFHFMGYYTVEVCKSFGKLFMGDFSSMSGLIGIYDTIDSVATDGNIGFGLRVLNIVYIIGAISFSLGFFNLIPFPALDGGRLVFVAIQAIFKKKVNPNVEGTIHFVGIILLFALMIIINIRDVFNLFK